MEETKLTNEEELNVEETSEEEKELISELLKSTKRELPKDLLSLFICEYYELKDKISRLEAAASLTSLFHRDEIHKKDKEIEELTKKVAELEEKVNEEKNSMLHYFDKYMKLKNEKEQLEEGE